MKSIGMTPILRKEIDSNHPNLRENVRKKYLENGPCQPRTIDFSLQKVGDKEKQRRFIGE